MSNASTFAVHVSVYVSVHFSVYVSAHVSIYVSVHVSVCLLSKEDFIFPSENIQLAQITQANERFPVEKYLFDF